ncbi:MAG: RNA polymerase sigma factor [Anaerolineae bacterium]|nr:RNA polymerase sigma factor [Anaerolineae bacterium]
MDDERVYAQLLRGDAAALAELMQRYHGPLYRFVYRQTGDSALADDLVQETFIRLLTYRGSAPARFKAWAYTIARNLAYDHLKSARHRNEEASAAIEDLLPDTDGSVFSHDSRDEVIAALGRLPTEQREVLILRFYHEFKLEEIAEVTGVALGTVKSRLFHALKAMKGFLTVMEVVDDRSRSDA